MTESTELTFSMMASSPANVRYANGVKSRLCKDDDKQINAMQRVSSRAAWSVSGGAIFEGGLVSIDWLHYYGLIVGEPL
jgi:hypothetical protein